MDKMEEIMEFKVTKEEKNVKTVEYTATYDEFNKYIDKAFKKNKSKFSIPGFRKGKAPRKIVELNYGKEVFYEEAVDMMLDEAYPKSIVELELKPVISPEFSLEEIGEEGVKVTVVITERPEVVLGEYKNLKVEKTDTTVTDEDVDKALENERKKNSRQITVEDRPAEMKDIVTIDFKGYVDGEAFQGGEAKGHALELGSGSFIPGFEEQLVGANVGDRVEVNVTFPENYTEELKGKDAKFDVDIVGIKTVELPELDDDFISEISEFETVDEYRENKKKEIEDRKKTEAENVAKENALKQALENMTLELTDKMIEDRFKSNVDYMEQNIKNSGLDLNTYLQFSGMTLEQFNSVMKTNAEKELKLDYLFEAIVEKEGITSTREEVIELIKTTMNNDKDDYEEDSNIYKHFLNVSNSEKAKALITDTCEEE